MNPETGSFARCVKHPSQFFTGFCLTCLVERLSNVDSVGSVRSPSCGVRDEALEISESVADSQRKSDGVRVRKTLLSLFELDDLQELEKMELGSDRHNVRYGETSEIGQPGLDIELEPEGLGDRAGSSGRAGASGFTSFDGEKSEPFEGESLTDRRISLWLHSKLPMRWKSSSASKKGRMPERCLNTGIGNSYLEDKPELGISCNWMDSAAPSNICWERPRHSWDGSLMSKALACSFSCLEERRDGSGKMKESLPDEAAPSDLQRSSGANDICKVNNGILADHNSLPLDGSVGDFPKRSCQDITASDGCRKKSNGWSRVWDWSISSPFRDFGKKNGHVLDRSLSESWRDNHRDRNAKKFHPGVEVHRSGIPHGDTVAASANRHGQKPDLLKMREFRLSRSHSVRYSSPRNVDNGLLRFYLTPLRTSRRNTAKYRRRTSHAFARGFFAP